MSILGDQIICEELISNLKNCCELDLSNLHPIFLPESLKNANNLVKLVLNDCGLIIPDWISDLAELEFLDLTENTSVHLLLPNIHNLRKLKFLSLANTDLEYLPENFSLLTNLEEINLDGAKFTVFPKVIGQLRNLKSVSLKYSLCSQEDVFRTLSELPNLKTLQITFINGFIPYPLSDSVLMLRNLEELDLSMTSNIKSIPDKIDSMSNLRILSLAQNIEKNDFGAIEELPESIVTIKSLESIDISGCSSIIDFPRGMHELPNLKSINISESGINNISSYLSREQIHGLEELGIQGKIPDLTGCTKLQHLYIYRNPTFVCYDGKIFGIETEFDYDIPKLQNLESFKIYGGKIRNVDFLLNFPMLRYLQLVCDMEYIPFSIDTLKELEYFEIFGAEHLKTFPESITNLKKLRKFILTACGLQTIIAPDNLESLEIMHLHKVKRIDESIFRCKHLKTFTIEKCSSLESLEGIGEFEELSCLEIRNCPSLSHLPDDISLLRNLKKVVILNTQIEDINKISKIKSQIFLKTNINNFNEEFFLNSKIISLELYCINNKDILNKIQLNSTIKSLNLSFSTETASIPNSILKNMTIEYIRISNTFPEGIENLKNIKYVELTNIQNKYINEIKDTIKRKNLHNIKIL